VRGSGVRGQEGGWRGSNRGEEIHEETGGASIAMAK
jgi:hypothetical protein